MKFFKYIFILFLLLGFSIQVKASVSEGTINAGSHYALLCEDDTCATTSQINFLTTSGGIVHVYDNAITGNIWSSKMGWINLYPSHGGVTNTINGVLGGYAWGESTGWINFAPTHGGVSIDTNGNFTGWAWAQNAGWIKFNCAVANACVNTDWRPVSARPKNGGHPPAPVSVPAPTLLSLIHI